MKKEVKRQTVEKKIKKEFVGILTVVNVELLFVLLCVLTMVVRLHKEGVSYSAGIVALVVIVIAIAGAIVLCLRAIKKLKGYIMTPVEEIQNAVHKLKDGDLDVQVSYKGDDELGDMAASLNEVCEHMNAIINDAGYMLGEMADGDFNVASKVDQYYVGQFKLLEDGMDKVTNKMSEVLHNIAEATAQVKVGAEQLSHSAQELAEGATEQAGAIEELTATIENVANISEESAKNATFAATSAKTAAENAAKNKDEINELTEAMARITETSQEIENIISAIEDIASQTNLLSLNASIEAARAGEAGKGFAVVAEQIGKLAEESASSAVTTRELISKSLEEIKVGNKIVENTMEAINAVLADMQSFAEMASGAAESSRVQADLLKQIEGGIEQISMVVQSNSASAEETSAVSEELSSQSINLEAMVEKFQLK